MKLQKTKLCSDCRKRKARDQFNPRTNACCIPCQKRRDVLERRRLREARETRQQAYDRFADAEGECCRICGVEASDTVKLNVDHDHGCCRFGCHECRRGLLCSGCNCGLGFFKDDPDRLAAAIQYLHDWAE
jgi:hypothetical protein